MNRKDYIKQEIETGMTFAEVGAQLGISPQRVWMIYTGYKSKKSKRPKSQRVFKYGLPIRLFGRDYTREVVRFMDGYMCQKCRKIWQPGQRRFDVHHLYGECGKKSLDYDSVFDVGKLITLCHKCHSNLDIVRNKMHSGRKIKQLTLTTPN